MRLLTLRLCALVFSTPALADAADSDSTPVPVCDAMPASAIIEAVSNSDARTICRAMGPLDGIRVQDIRTFSKAVVVLSREGYDGTDREVAEQLVAIVRLRGFYDKPGRWYPTLDLVVRTYQAFNGVVSPLDVVAFLRAAGSSAAHGLSDDGLSHMLIYVKLRKQQGDD